MGKNKKTLNNQVGVPMNPVILSVVPQSSFLISANTAVAESAMPAFGMGS